MSPHHERETIGAVDWTALFPSLKLSKAVREALQPARLAVGFLWCFSVVAVAFAWGRTSCGTMPNQPGDPFAVWLAHGMPGVAGVVLDMCCASPGACAAAGIPLILSTVFGGAAISRLAALDIARGEWGRPRQVLDFLRARTFSLLSAPVLLFVIPGVLFGLLALAGRLLMGSEAGRCAADALFGLFVLAGLAAVIVLAAGLAASALLLPAVAVDGNDGFDAPGRAVSYVLARPCRFAANMAVLAALGAAGWFVAAQLRDGSVRLVTEALAAGCPNSAAANHWWESPWLFLLDMCGVAYAFSFLMTGLTRVYLVIRESADGVPETELWNPSDDKKVTMGMEDGAPAAQADGHE